MSTKVLDDLTPLARSRIHRWVRLPTRGSMPIEDVLDLLASSRDKYAKRGMTAVAHHYNEAILIVREFAATNASLKSLGYRLKRAGVADAVLGTRIRVYRRVEGVVEEHLIMLQDRGSVFWHLQGFVDMQDGTSIETYYTQEESAKTFKDAASAAVSLIAMER